MRRLVFIILLSLPLFTPPGYADEIAAIGDLPQVSEPWTGSWQLDFDASDSVEPMLEAMHVPWIARKVAVSMTPTMTITALDHGGLRVINENPLRRSDQEIFVDGVARERIDALDRRVVRRAGWNDAGQLVIHSQNHVEDDEVVGVKSTWSLTGDTIVISNALQRDDGPLVIRRVFRKQ